MQWGACEQMCPIIFNARNSVIQPTPSIETELQSVWLTDVQFSCHKGFTLNNRQLLISFVTR